jgi:hypothetical protein
LNLKVLKLLAPIAVLHGVPESKIESFCGDFLGRRRVARHRFWVTHWPPEHLMDKHIGRFNADADNLSTPERKCISGPE